MKARNKKANKYFTVYYTPLPCEEELIVRANSADHAVQIAKNVLGYTLGEIKKGYEVKDF